MDYISREEILAEYDRQHKGPAGGARKIMETWPAADVVPVVRCKDCENAIDIGKEYLLCPMIDYRVKADFFCAYGERRK